MYPLEMLIDKIFQKSELSYIEISWLHNQIV